MKRVTGLGGVFFKTNDPKKIKSWYEKHLGMHTVRKGDGPIFGHFIADEDEKTVLEVYRQNAPIPDYPSQHVFVFHIAFVVDDVAAERARLLKAGATPAGEVTKNPNGDVMAFLRDPWGVVLQLVKRAEPLIPPGIPY